MIKSLLPYLPGFAAVAEHQSFSRAANELALSQAAVSYQIKQLEERLGFALFIRKQGSKISLTQKGALLLEEYQQLARELDGLLTTLSPTMMRSRISLTAPVDLGSKRLNPLLPALEQQGLIADLHLADQQVDLCNSRFDLAIRRDCNEPQLAYLPLPACANRLVCSPAYANEHGLPTRVSELPAHRLLLRQRHQSRSWQELLRRADLDLASLPEVRVLGNSFALLEAALAGWGLALLPDYLVAEPMAQGRLQAVTLQEGEPLATPFYLAYYPAVTTRRWAEQIAAAVANPISWSPIG